MSRPAHGRVLVNAVAGELEDGEAEVIVEDGRPVDFRPNRGEVGLNDLAGAFVGVPDEGWRGP
ncbi:MAG TPA: hypothetical protein VHN99_04005 [Deinococcales bacterium]|nr:hypothetical protein [Deinococcales bacterium]